VRQIAGSWAESVTRASVNTREDAVSWLGSTLLVIWFPASRLAGVWAATVAEGARTGLRAMVP
jgi:hypothetical protein